MATHSSIPAWRIPWEKSLAGYCPQSGKQSDTAEQLTLSLLLVVQCYKNPPANAGDEDQIPGLGRSPREGNGNPLQYSCLENPMDRGAWQALQFMENKRVRHDLATKQQ